jgi:hypothetical protein
VERSPFCVKEKQRNKRTEKQKNRVNNTLAAATTVAATTVAATTVAATTVAATTVAATTVTATTQHS